MEKTFHYSPHTPEKRGVRDAVGEILEHSHIQPESDVDTPSVSEADLTFKDLAKEQCVDPIIYIIEPIIQES